MGKTLRSNAKYPKDYSKHESSRAKTKMLEGHHHIDPVNQGGVHVGDQHVHGKRLQRTWPKGNEAHSGHRKV